MRSPTRDERLAQLAVKMEAAEEACFRAETALNSLPYNDPDYADFTERYHDARWAVAQIMRQMQLLRRRA